MRVEVAWSRRARGELVQIGAVLRRVNPRAADDLVLRIIGGAASLADQPHLGARRSDIRASLRQLVSKPYLILYRTVPDTDHLPVYRVEIVSVVDGRRDLPRLF